MDRKKACMELYKEAFGDDGEFLVDLFENNFEHCRYIMKDGEAAAMLFLLPCVLVLKGKRLLSFYLYAAATAKKYRKQGVMSKLLNQTLKSESAPIFLKPATEELIDFYKKRGFKTISAMRSKSGENVIESKFFEFGGEVIRDGSEYTLMYHYDIPIEVTNIAFDSPME